MQRLRLLACAVAVTLAAVAIGLYVSDAVFQWRVGEPPQGVPPNTPPGSSCSGSSIPNGSSGLECQDGVVFAFETVTANSSRNASNSSVFVFQKVTFSIWLSGITSGGAAWSVEGSEGGKQVAVLEVADGPPHTPPWDTQISSDRSFGAQMEVGAFDSIRLLAS
jgi:hypothetical protein